MKKNIVLMLALMFVFCGCVKSEPIETESLPANINNKFKVIITVDVEDNRGSVPNLIDGRFNGNDCGVYYIMDTAEKYGAPIVFFTNVYEHGLYDEDYMPNLLKTIDSRGHEVALHAHASSTTVDWYTGSIINYDYEGQKRILEYGCDYIENAIGKRPVSFRGGAYRVNNTTFKALQDLGIVYESSQYYGKEDANRLEGMTTINMMAQYDNLIEFPVVQVQIGGSNGKIKKLDLDVMSAEQIISVFEQAKEANFGAIQIMFHSFSFMKEKGDGEPVLTENNKLIYGADTADMKKFEEVLKYVSESDDMEIVTFRELSEEEAIIPDPENDMIFKLNQ